MTSRFVAMMSAVLAVGTAACSAPTARSLSDEAMAAMGGADKVRAIRTITMKDGAGTRDQLLEPRHVGEAEPSAKLSKVTEIVDLAGGRASLHYVIDNAGFMQDRHEVMTRRNGKLVGLDYVGMRPVVATSVDGLFSWGTQNNPEITLRRSLVPILLAAAESTAGASDENFAGRNAAHAHVTVNGEDIGLYFDPQTKLLIGFETTDSEALTGDVPAQYVLDNYKAVDGVLLPHKITITKGGKPYSMVEYAGGAINDAAAEKDFEIPEAASKQADEAIAAGVFSPVALDKVADGVYFARAYSHNSLVVEFPQWLAVVEAPYTDAQSATLVRVLGAQFPGKPIKYAAVTHPHSDHIGGVRGIAAAGAAVLVEKAHEAPLRTMIEAHHTRPADDLEKRRTANQPVGSIEIYEGKKVLSDGKQSLELYAFMGSPHVEPMVLAYVPSARLAFQSDLWFPGTGAPAGPEAKQLLEAIRALKLNVATHAGGHGGVGPAAALEKAVAAMK
ncbi:MAG TPA: MBL fold metallo-hydrolase [Vicinamibacterales bacterium]|nr:MBL fold metallo-hydrolase [Vicinamibacterales bacterium]